jgi:hypothetical protein
MDNILEQNNNDPLKARGGSGATSSDPLGARGSSGVSNNDPLKARGGSGSTDNDPLKAKSDTNDPLKAKTNTTPVTSDVFACLLNNTETPKIVKTSSPRQVRRVFDDETHYFFSDYFFQITDKTGKTVQYKGTWKCDGDKDFIINTEDGDEYSTKAGKWKGPTKNNNSNSNSNNNSGSGTSLVDTTLTADDLKAGKFVKKGMKGKIVGDIQNLLIKLGYTDVSKSGKADDKFGSRTEKMVKDFQKANDLTDDGSVGEKTWPKLNDPAAVKNSGSSSSSSSSSSGALGSSNDNETEPGSDIIIKESLKKSLRKNLLKFN